MLFPDMKLPHKFKTPDLDKYDGTGCPFTHLKVYCGEMCLYGDNERLLIQQFQKKSDRPCSEVVRPVRPQPDPNMV